MSIENKNLNEQENFSPFNVEKIKEINVPEIKLKDDKLLINGIVQEKYKNIVERLIRFQENNPNLLYLQANEKENYIARVIDINNPEKELLNIEKDEKTTFGKGNNLTINGKKWDSLSGKIVYYDGYRAEIDPDGKNIVFCAINESKSYSNNQEHKIIVNNVIWDTKFDSIHSASSIGGVAYAFGGSRENNKFAINDKKMDI